MEGDQRKLNGAGLYPFLLLLKFPNTWFQRRRKQMFFGMASCLKEICLVSFASVLPELHRKQEPILIFIHPLNVLKIHSRSKILHEAKDLKIADVIYQKSGSRISISRETGDNKVNRRKIREC